MDVFSAILFGCSSIISFFPFYVIPLLIQKTGIYSIICFLFVGIIYFVLSYIMIKIYSIVGKNDFFDFLQFQYGSSLKFTISIFYFLLVLGTCTILYSMLQNQFLLFFNIQLSKEIGFLLFFILIIPNILIQKFIKKIDFYFSILKFLFIFSFIIYFGRLFIFKKIYFIPKNITFSIINENLGICFFSLSGFETLFSISKNLKDSTKNFSKVVFSTIFFSITIYIVLNLLFLGTINFKNQIDPIILLLTLIQSNCNYFFKIFFYIGLLFLTFSTFSNWCSLIIPSYSDFLNEEKRIKQFNKNTKKIIGFLISNLLFYCIFQLTTSEFIIAICSIIVMYLYILPIISFSPLLNLLQKKKFFYENIFIFFIFFSISSVLLFCEKKINYILNIILLILCFFSIYSQKPRIINVKFMVPIALFQINQIFLNWILNNNLFSFKFLSFQIITLNFISCFLFLIIFEVIMCFRKKDLLENEFNID